MIIRWWSSIERAAHRRTISIHDSDDDDAPPIEPTLKYSRACEIGMGLIREMKMCLFVVTVPAVAYN